MEQAGDIAFNCLGAQRAAWAEHILGSCNNFPASHNTAENKNGATKKSPVGIRHYLKLAAVVSDGNCLVNMTRRQ
jgi:hypothetical protein